MGAQEFTAYAKGKTAQAAFSAAVEQACYDYGHAGYTGSIAEKHEFVRIQVPVGEDPVAFANKLLADNDQRIDDKWGPAGCVEVKAGEYYFFGWASS